MHVWPFYVLESVVIMLYDRQSVILDFTAFYMESGLMVLTLLFCHDIVVWLQSFVNGHQFFFRCHLSSVRCHYKYSQ